MRKLGLTLNTASHGGHPGHRRHGAQPAGRLHRPDLVRPRHLVRHRRLCCRRSLQKHWLHDQIVDPILLSMVFVAVLSTVVGVLILRRRGVYFSLLTLALAALTYTIAFRWSEVTGGEDGLGGLGARQRSARSISTMGSPSTSFVAADRAGRAVCAAARGALAVRARADGDPREPAARHVPGLSRRALQAGGVRAFGRGDRPRPARCSVSRPTSSRPRPPRWRSRASCWRWS